MFSGILSASFVGRSREGAWIEMPGGDVFAAHAIQSLP